MVSEGLVPMLGRAGRGARKWMQRLRSYQERQLLLASLAVGKRTPFADHRVLFVYKDYWSDHSLYSLILALKRRYSDVVLLKLSSEDRPRDPAGIRSDRLYAAIEKSRPTLVFAYNTILTLREMQRLREMGLKVATFTNGVASFSSGCAWSQEEAIAAMRLYNWYLVPHAPHIKRLREEGVNAIEFPFWYDPQWFRPLNRPKLYEVLFVGDFTTPLNTNRLSLLKSLAGKYKVAVASHRRPEVDGIQFLGHSDSPIVLNRWLNEAWLVIGSDRLDDIGSLNRADGQYILYTDTHFIRQRVCLVAGSGACYVTDRHPELERFYTAGQEMVMFNSAEELPGVGAPWGPHTARCREIGLRAADRAKADHSTEVRVSDLLRIITSS